MVRLWHLKKNVTEYKCEGRVCGFNTPHQKPPYTVGGFETQNNKSTIT